LHLTLNPISWIVVPPLSLWQNTPWWFHVGFVLTFAWLAFELIRVFENRRRYGIDDFDLRDPLAAAMLVLSVVMAVWLTVVASALWVVSIPVKLYRHDKRYRNLYKEVNAILGYH
jgi:hypothetical protein